jgi:hypothetical protein
LVIGPSCRSPRRVLEVRVREARVAVAPNLVLAAQPPAQPTDRVSIQRSIALADWTQAEVPAQPCKSRLVRCTIRAVSSSPVRRSVSACSRSTTQRMRGSHGNTGRHDAARPLGTACRTAHGTDSPVRPSLWHAAPSVASEHSAELLGCPISPSSLLLTLAWNQGPFPPPALPGFPGTTGLSATLCRPACPSRVSGSTFVPSTAKGFPCCIGLPVLACHRH